MRCAPLLLRHRECGSHTKGDCACATTRLDQQPRKCSRFAFGTRLLFLLFQRLRDTGFPKEEQEERNTQVLRTFSNHLSQTSSERDAERKTPYRIEYMSHGRHGHRSVVPIRGIWYTPLLCMLPQFLFCEAVNRLPYSMVRTVDFSRKTQNIAESRVERLAESRMILEGPVRFGGQGDSLTLRLLQYLQESKFSVGSPPCGAVLLD